MREYGFTPAERDTYFDQKRVYSSFGRDTVNDFIILHVYSPDSTSADNANLLGTKILSLGEVELENGGNFIDVNVGQHLRDMGLVEGEYKVVYKFLRRLAGRERTIFVDGNGQVWTGEYQVKIINGVRRYYTGTPGDKTSGVDKVELIELFPRDKHITIFLSASPWNPIPDLSWLYQLPSAFKFSAFWPNIFGNSYFS